MILLCWTYLTENGEIEIIMVICYNDITGIINTHTNRIVCNTFSTNLANKLPIIIEYL